MQNSGWFGLLATYQGRINRAKYWTTVLIYVAIMVVLIAIGFIMFGNSILALSDDTAGDGVIMGLVSKGIGFVLILLIVYIPMIISGVFVGIKRLHDRDKSGWWLLVFYLLPAVLNFMGDTSMIFSLAGFAISIWGLVELGFLRGTAGPESLRSRPIGHLKEQPMRMLGLIAAVFFAGTTAVYAADPDGEYQVEGANPGGGGAYTGTVTVRKTGETYSVIWVVGGTRYIGTGIGNKDFLAVSYRSGNDTGLALYGEDGGNWTGIWTYAGGKKVGAERWHRQ